jgi:RHS repeat-associated protein
VYDGNLVVQERNGANLPQVTYTRGIDINGTLQGAGGIGGLLARTDNTRLMVADPFASAYYHCDGNGNVTCLMTPYQQLAAKYLYDPYGNLLAMSGPLAAANVYRFSSKEWDGNAGMYYYLYRFYDPNLQRWVNRDPIAEKGFETVRHIVSIRARTFMPPLMGLQGPNLYEFVANNPISKSDTLGLSWMSDFDWCLQLMDVGHVCEFVGAPAGGGSFIPRGPVGKVCRRIAAPVAGYCAGIVAGCAADATAWNTPAPVVPVDPITPISPFP